MNGRSGASEGMVVHKYGLRPWSIFLDVRRGAQLLHVGAPDKRNGYVWALVDPEAPLVPRIVFAHPTGVPLPHCGEGTVYVGTFKINEGGDWLIFHVFDGGEREDQS